MQHPPRAVRPGLLLLAVPEVPVHLQRELPDLLGDQRDRRPHRGEAHRRIDGARFPTAVTLEPSESNSHSLGLTTARS
jgi:hypothetical protein